MKSFFLKNGFLNVKAEVRSSFNPLYFFRTSWQCLSKKIIRGVKVQLYQWYCPKCGMMNKGVFLMK